MQKPPVYESIRNTSRLLMGPGPSNVSPTVLRTMSAPLLGHMDPDFNKIMDETQSMLRYCFQTNNKLTYPVSGTGSAGMETMLVNMIEPGDKMLVGINGVFGGRMADMAERAGAEVVTISTGWCKAFDPDQIVNAVKKHSPKLVGLVHAETSTGVSQPLEEIGSFLAENDVFFLIDCVTSLGGSELRIDDWHVDAAFSGTQKCLSCPPGMAPITFSEKAEKKITSRRSKTQSWYFDLSMIQNYWGERRSYHHTAPINMAYAMHESLRIVCSEGLEKRWQRHSDVSAYLGDFLGRSGFKYIAEAGFRLPQLNAVYVPDPTSEAQIRRTLLRNHKIEIGGGLGEFAGKAWRIGLMGETCSKENVDTLANALKECI